MPKTTAICMLFFTLFHLGVGEVFSQDIQFRKKGKLVRVLSLNELQKMITPKVIRVFDPNADQEMDYRGFPINQLLRVIYGKDWDQAEEALFTAADGFQASMAIDRFKRFQAALVYSRPGLERFFMVNKLSNSQEVDLGPFYLIWNNILHPELRVEAGYDWPYRVVSVDLINFMDRFPKIAPPKGSSAQVKRGFAAYRRYCSSCHAINGEGGVKSVDLNYPQSVTEYWTESGLRQLMIAPEKLRHNTKMPGLNPRLKNKNKTVDQILAYLKAMKSRKIAPEKAKTTAQ